MALSGSLQLFLELGICRSHGHSKQFPLQKSKTSGKLCILRSNLHSISVTQCSWSSKSSKRVHQKPCLTSSRNHQFRCHCFLNPGSSLDPNCVKNATLTLARSINQIQGSPFVIRLASGVCIVLFAVWGLGPLVRLSRNILLQKHDSNWKRSSTYQVITSYVQPLLLWAGAILVCRTLDPMTLPTEAGQIVKQRLVNFVRSLSTVLAFAYCLSSVIQQGQRFFMETNDPTDTRNMGFQFAGRAVYTAVWVAAVSLFMELLGFSTKKWLTAGGLGTVLLTLAGREIFTNFLSSAMIHATRPFVLNEWVQTNIEGYAVSGTVEHIGWWSPTIIRGEDREAIHIPNHKFTVNVVRNLSQKTHWRIKTHIAISHLDVSKINNIVADMRKVLAKNPQVEQKKLHRRIFLDNINPENQALMVLVSCFVKTSHFEEYLCVKEAVLLDLLRVIRHHRARLATPIRTVQKVFTDADLDNVPFSDSMFDRGAVSNRPLLLIEPSYKINGEDKARTQARPARATGEEDSKASPKSTPDNKVDPKAETTSTPDSKSKATSTEAIEDPKVAAAKTSPTSKTKHSQKVSQETNLTSPAHPKQDGGRQTVAQKPPLEENIVLGVALEGSKRTLPIEEETVLVPPLTTEDTKELATMRSNGASMSEMDKSDTKRSKNSASQENDQLDQHE